MLSINPYVYVHGRIQRVEGSDPQSPPPEKSQNIGFLRNIGPDPLNNHNATKPTLNVKPSSARQRNAILKALRWRAYDGTLIVVLGSSLPSFT